VTTTAAVAIAVPAALGAACSFGVGVALQHRQIQRERGRGPLQLLSQLVRRRLWLAGLGLAVAAYGLQAVALAFGPLAVVAPVVAADLLFALPIAAAWEGRRMRPVDWAGCAIVGAGIRRSRPGQRRCRRGCGRRPPRHALGPASDRHRGYLRHDGGGDPEPDQDRTVRRWYGCPGSLAALGAARTWLRRATALGQRIQVRRAARQPAHHGHSRASLRRTHRSCRVRRTPRDLAGHARAAGRRRDWRGRRHRATRQVPARGGPRRATGRSPGVSTRGVGSCPPELSSESITCLNNMHGPGTTGDMVVHPAPVPAPSSLAAGHGEPQLGPMRMCRGAGCARRSRARDLRCAALLGGMVRAVA
jgi:hypothetical protein